MALDSAGLQQIVGGSSLGKRLMRKAGAAVAVLQSGRLGVATLGQGVDAATPVELGSVTKAFTGMLLAEAVMRGELRLDSRVDEVILGEEWTPRSISAQELATHFSGLPKVSLPFWRLVQTQPYAAYSREDLIASLRRRRPREPVSPRYRYSNLGYAVLGLMLEKAAGQSYEALLQERLLGPLGMRRTHLQMADGPVWSQAGYRRYKVGTSLFQYRYRTPPWRFEAYAPCGAMASTLEDLVVGLRGLVEAAGPMAKAVDLSVRPLATIPGGAIGMGWHLAAERSWFWHNGSTYGHSAYLGGERQKGAGVAIVANQMLPVEVTGLGHELMRGLVSAS